MNRILADENIPRASILELRKADLDVSSVAEIRTGMSDLQVLEIARSEERLLWTFDRDFGELIYLENLSHAGLVRLPDVPAHERKSIMQDLLTRYETELQDAAIITVRGDRIRISKGPKQN